jgi:hypothetical protein
VDRSSLWRSRISGAPLRSAIKLAQIAYTYLRCFALHRIRDTHLTQPAWTKG